MAASSCACVKAGKQQCEWCKEAEKNGFKDHNCQWGKCS